MKKIYNSDIFFCNYECSKYKNSFIIYIKYTLSIFGLSILKKYKMNDQFIFFSLNKLKIKYKQILDLITY